MLFTAYAYSGAAPECSETAASVAQIVYNKHTREQFQSSASRGNPNLVTPVELDNIFPRSVPLAVQCKALVTWEANYKLLSRYDPASDAFDAVIPALRLHTHQLLRELRVVALS